MFKFVKQILLPMKKYMRWLTPFWFALVTYLAMRLVLDIPRNRDFLAGSSLYVVCVDILLCSVAYYMTAFTMKYWINYCRKKNISSWIEYGSVILTSVLFLYIACHIEDYLGKGYKASVGSVIIVETVGCLCGIIAYIYMRNKEIEKAYMKQSLQMEQMKSEHLETELRLLKSQYHPHFLFNALNTIYFQIDEANTQPRYTIEKLSDLLRYQLYTIDKKVDIAQEIAYTNSYIELMKMRKSEDLKLTVHIDKSVKDFDIYPLLFQPLVENAFKYVGGLNYITISLSKEKNQMTFMVCNSIPSIQKDSQHKGKGLGIENLRRRLDLLYPSKYLFSTNKKENEFVAQLTLISVA